MSEKLEENLRAEYLLIQNHYEQYDARVLNIKYWSIILVSGAIAAGIESGNISVLYLSIVACLIMWLLESLWKTFQWAHVQRIKEIEKWFRDPKASNMVPFQIYTSWADSWKNYRTARVFLTPFVIDLLPFPTSQ